jgi:HSP20 family protein
MIALDVFESPSQHVDLPGLQKDQVTIRIKDNILIISGERRCRGRNVPFSERVMGSFERRVRLPTIVDLSMVDASMVNGFLEVKIGM